MEEKCMSQKCISFRKTSRFALKKESNMLKSQPKFGFFTIYIPYFWHFGGKIGSLDFQKVRIPIFLLQAFFLYNVIKHEAASYGKAIYFWFWYNSLYCRNIVIFLISVFFQIKLDLLKNPNSSLALRFNQEYFFQRYPHKWQHSTMNQPGIF